MANCQFIFSYLKGDFRISHHSSEPAQSTIYEPQDGKEGYKICCDVSDKSYRGRCSTASSLQNVLFIPRSVYTHKVSTFRKIIYERQVRTGRGRCTHPAETFTFFSDLKGLSSVSGYDSLEMAKAQGAAITEAAIKEDASICKIE